MQKPKRSKPESDRTLPAKATLSWHYWGAGALMVLATVLIVLGLGQGRQAEGVSFSDTAECELHFERACVSQIGDVVLDQPFRNPAVRMGVGAFRSWSLQQEALYRTPERVSIHTASGVVQVQSAPAPVSWGLVLFGICAGWVVAA
ncbi:MAG: hypothetical protein ACI9VR_003002, partial [Cognaticolwellia sp.]